MADLTKKKKLEAEDIFFETCQNWRLFFFFLRLAADSSCAFIYVISPMLLSIALEVSFKVVITLCLSLRELMCC